MAKDLIKERAYWGLPVSNGKFMTFVAGRRGTGTVAERSHTGPSVDGRERKRGKAECGLSKPESLPSDTLPPYNHTP